MSLAPESSVPPGWYPDPQGSFQQRWWTGTTWTNDFAQLRPTMAASHSTAAALQASIHAQQAQQAQEQQAQAQQALAQQALLMQQALVGLAQHQPAHAQPLHAQPAHVAQHAAAPQQSFVGGAHAATVAPPVLAPQVAQPPVAAAPAVTMPAAPPQIAGFTGYGSATAPLAAPSVSGVAIVPVAPVPRTTIGAVNPIAGADYQPFSSVSTTRAGARQSATRRHTIAAWVLAFLPLVPLGAAYALATLTPDFYGIVPQFVLLAIFVAGAVGLAGVDRHTLQADGHEVLASPAFAIIPPLYLVIRSTLVAHEARRGAISPFLVSLLVIGGSVAAVMVVPGLSALLAGPGIG